MYEILVCNDKRHLSSLFIHEVVLYVQGGFVYTLILKAREST